MNSHLNTKAESIGKKVVTRLLASGHISAAEEASVLLGLTRKDMLNAVNSAIDLLPAQHKGAVLVYDSPESKSEQLRQKLWLLTVELRKN